MKRSDLVAKLELLAPAVANDNLIPVYENYCFDGEEVFAYNDSLGIVTACQQKEAFALNGKTLLGLLSNSHSEEVEFLIEGDHELTVKTGRSRFKLPYMVEDEFLFKPPSGKWDLE